MIQKTWINPVCFGVTSVLKILVVSASLAGFEQLAHAEDLLPAPGAIVVLPDGIDLDIGECGHTYRVERSFDSHHWKIIGTHTPSEVSRGPDPMDAYCEHDFVDAKNVIPHGAKAVYYRYFEIKGGHVIGTSEVETIDMTDKGPWAENYWDRAKEDRQHNVK